MFAAADFLDVGLMVATTRSTSSLRVGRVNLAGDAVNQLAEIGSDPAENPRGEIVEAQDIAPRGPRTTRLMCTGILRYCSGSRWVGSPRGIFAAIRH